VAAGCDGAGGVDVDRGWGHAPCCHRRTGGTGRVVAYRDGVERRIVGFDRDEVGD